MGAMEEHTHPTGERPPADADTELKAANRELWDSWVELHVPSEFYDLPGFIAGRDTLDPVELDEVFEAVGEIKGKSLLHLQCHFGLDTLSWARHGARVTGIDFSGKAVAHARRLAAELEIDARFHQADVTDPGAVAAALAKETFDVVFTSHGAICWLPDLQPWARTIADSLKPGGIFFICDSHPFTSLFDETNNPELRIRFDYFYRQALAFEEKGSYAVPDADFEGVSYSWQHPFEEIMGSLTEVGLCVGSLREYPYLFWRWFSWMVKDADGSFRLPDGMPRIPLMFSLTATKPEGSV